MENINTYELEYKSIHSKHYEWDSSFLFHYLRDNEAFQDLLYKKIITEKNEQEKTLQSYLFFIQHMKLSCTYENKNIFRYYHFKQELLKKVYARIGDRNIVLHVINLFMSYIYNMPNKEMRELFLRTHISKMPRNTYRYMVFGALYTLDKEYVEELLKLTQYRISESTFELALKFYTHYHPSIYIGMEKISVYINELFTFCTELNITSYGSAKQFKFLIEYSYKIYRDSCFRNDYHWSEILNEYIYRVMELLDTMIKYNDIPYSNTTNYSLIFNERYDLLKYSIYEKYLKNVSDTEFIMFLKTHKYYQSIQNLLCS